MAKTALALGTFDGVHSGHISVINAAVSSGYRAVAVAFPEPPRTFFNGQTELLSTPHEKQKILFGLGVENVHFLDFEKIKDMPPEEFLLYLKNTFNPAFISCGFNHRFGKGGKGDTALLRDFCDKNNIKLSVAEAVTVGDKILSSTYIRSLLRGGEINTANRYLARPFGFSGEVVHGDSRGRTIGFPTINQFYPKTKAPVRFGVYKSLVTVDGKTYNGITNVGIRPSFKTDAVMAETYILDFSGDIYGTVVDLRLIEFIRNEQKFSNTADLKKAIENDINNAKY